MTRELLILRHGKSDWDAGTNDYHRPLTNRGVKNAQQIGNWLAHENLIPDYTISSTATRAMTTAEFTLNAMGLGAQDIHKEKKLYIASLDEILSVLSKCPKDAKRIMIVGHNPGLQDLLEYLVDDIPVPRDGKVLPTATVAHLKMPSDWKSLRQGDAKLLSLIKPIMLSGKTSLSKVKSTDVRNKSAYYCQQASALPYRITDKGKIEILIIRSRKRKKWIIPKGIQESGQSARDAAIIEAREEAGVEGEVSQTSIYCYRYRKWGNTCVVRVFPMRVTHILPEKQWEERYRGRKWVKPKVAIKRIKQDAIKELLPTFIEGVKSSS